METLTYTLVSDGSSDRALIPIIDWLLSTTPGIGDSLFVAQFADFRHEVDPPRKLDQRIERALAEYPCRLLFVHRDAEIEPLEARVQEISTAATSQAVSAFVPVVPVRMTEAWLLIDPMAIRSAAGNPNGNTPLDLPPLHQLEAVRDPKKLLLTALLAASEKSGRRLRQFERDLHRRKGRVAEHISDFSPLRSLSAFRYFETATLQALDAVRTTR